ncbi:MAG: helix-turn-helix domain-containing protein [Candidatus Bathyarchaeia archaeon]
MRRLVLEILEEELSKIEKDMPLQKIKSFEVLYMLRFDHEEFAYIVKVEFKDPSVKVEDLFLKGAKIQLLEQDKNGVFTYFINDKMRRHTEEQGIMPFDVYLSPPFGLREGKLKIVFLGDEKQVKNLLENIDKTGIRYKVVSLIDAKFSPESPLTYLTEKQRTVLVSAFEHGYYETPRRISNQELSKKLKLNSATIVEHRRKAEQRLLTRIIKNA